MPLPLTEGSRGVAPAGLLACCQINPNSPAKFSVPALVEGKKEVNYTSMAGVGMLLAMAGVMMARRPSRGGDAGSKG